MTKLSSAAGHVDLPARLQHPSHSHPGERHMVKLVLDDGVRFRCDGCKLPGAGARYECEHGEACNHDLHIRCALATPLREIAGQWFVLLHEPLAGDDGRRTICDACGGAATGFIYHSEQGHDVHPCCADLPDSLNVAGVSLELHMNSDEPHRHCPICREKKKKKSWWGGRRRVNRRCWSYRSVPGVCGDDDDVFLHVPCARDMASDDFTDMINASLGMMAMAARDSETGTGSVVVDAASTSRVGDRSDQEMVRVKASALRALLLRGRGRGHRGSGRWLRILAFILRGVIGIIFGDPTAMMVALGQAIFPGDG